MGLSQWWAISRPRATCGPPQRFQWPAEAYIKYHQICNFLQLIIESVEADLNRDLLLFLSTCFYTRVTFLNVGRVYF